MLGVLRPGVVLGETYRVLRLVGKGGMGQVYEAENVRLDAIRVAIKVLVRGEDGAHGNAFARFKLEVEVTSRLQHANIVKVFDYNLTPASQPYFVMELLRGTDLASELRARGAMPVTRAIGIVRQIALGLSVAHRCGVVHRDLKPQNVFLVPDEDQDLVKIVDFGISKVREDTTELTQELSILGTQHYMAPEQAQGRLGDIDERTDVFALGAIAYEILTGRGAFSGETSTAVLYQVVHEQPVPPTQINAAISPPIEAVVFKALAKRQEQRFSSARELSEALDDAAESGGKPGAAFAAMVARTRESNVLTDLRAPIGETIAETRGARRPSTGLMSGRLREH